MLDKEAYDKEEAGKLFYQAMEHEAQSDFAAAEEKYQQALLLNPKSIAIYHALTLLLSRTGKMWPIDPLWAQCEQHLPTEWNPKLYRALNLIKNIRFDQGFQLREQLFRDHDDFRTTQPPPVNYPRWQGQDLRGRSIVIWSEYGFGDELMMCRFAAVLKQLGATHVSVLCQDAVFPVIATLREADLVLSISQLEQLPLHDYWVFPFAIPAYYSLQTHGIPAQVPYLYTDYHQVLRWQRYLPDDEERVLKVGLVWKGNASHENDYFRSIHHLSHLAPILGIPGIQWVSLQNGVCEAEWLEYAERCYDNPPAEHAETPLLPPLARPPILLGNKVDNFADTAAIIDSLDLIICVDTAVAHLAGALAKPVWVFISVCVDWRWQSTRGDSPWYPSARLFRQHWHDDWSVPLAAMQEKLWYHAQAHVHGLNGLRWN
ncbi:MAG: glycosyltransferase family 9 protein [Enterobacteriaceae bacterium]